MRSYWRAGNPRSGSGRGGREGLEDHRDWLSSRLEVWWCGVCGLWGCGWVWGVCGEVRGCGCGGCLGVYGCVWGV